MRATVADIERQLKDTAPGPLSASIASLVQQLDLGPEPKLRSCPACGATGMRAATRCGTCWVKLTPPLD
jgi:hypothetical protein